MTKARGGEECAEGGDDEEGAGGLKSGVKLEQQSYSKTAAFNFCCTE